MEVDDIGGSSRENVQLSYSTVYELLRSKNMLSSSTSVQTRQFLYNILHEKYNADGNQWYGEYVKKVEVEILNFTVGLKRRWTATNSSHRDFVLKYGEWLQKQFQLPELQTKHTSCTRPTSSSSSGRPQKDFSVASDKTKWRRVQQLRQSASTSELVFATKTSLYKEGKRAAAELVSQASEHSPGRPLKLRKIIREVQSGKQIVPYTPDEALAFMLDCNMTKDVYIKTRLGAKMRNANIYPSYDKLKDAKKRCYPDGITINDRGASIPLQHLLNHTVMRLSKLVDIPDGVTKINLISKWGCDGSSGHSEYMQTPTNKETPSNDDSDLENLSDVSEANLFLFSLVPLRLVSSNGVDQGESVIWENPRASSTRFCRPIKLLYAKETQELTRREVAIVEEEIRKLDPFEMIINGERIEFNFTLCLTMIDGKSINALTNTSSQTCYICKSKPTQMNQLDNVKDFEIDITNFQYGLTTMHAWIKFLECVLHISYKANLKAPTVRGASKEQLDEITARKKEIHQKLYKAMGIRVDKVVQGKGTSNTGNVGRTFFRNFKESAEITGVDEELIKRFGIILTALSSGYQLDYAKFNEFSHYTAKLYVEKYNWYRMPVSVHKILMHGAKAAEFMLLPIGLMSEEAQETSNKVYRRVREHHTRKSSKFNTTTDLIHTMLQLSDPVISNARELPKMEKKMLPVDVLPLLKVRRGTEEEDMDEERNEDEEERSAGAGQEDTDDESSD